MKSDALLRTRLALVKTKGQATLASEYQSQHTSQKWIKIELGQGFRSSGLSLIKDLFGTEHPYFKDFDQQAVGSTPSGFKRGLAIIEAIEDEVKNGWLDSTRALIAADLFSDFLEMAQHLFDEGYKDPAAVVAGSSLEAHLRRLCGKHGVDAQKPDGQPKKAESINAELHKAGAYELSEQKQITAWLGIRNDAAHGHYDKVIAGAVSLMIQGIRHFMSVRPA